MIKSDRVPLPDEWLCTKEVARRTKTSVSLWEKMRCEGRSPPYARIGRKVVLNWPVVVAWMESNGRVA